MRLVDKDGNDIDYDLIRWGPDGAWGIEELERDVLQVLPECEGYDVLFDLGSQPKLVYMDIPLGEVEKFVERGLVVESYLFGMEVLGLLRRNPDARLDAMVACSWDEEVGWFAVVRGFRLQESEPTAADYAACRDVSRTFLFPTDTVSASRRHAWSTGSRGT